MYYNNQQKQYNNQYSQQKNNQVEIPQFDFNHPTPELFSQTAEDWAKKCYVNANSNTNAGTQIRRFYDELILWNEKCTTQQIFQENLPYICMMKSKVAYANGRKLVDDNYKALIDGIINAVQAGNHKTLKNAKLFLEAFTGYFKFYEKERKNQHETE